MRNFIVLCLVAVACADHLGQDYHPVDRSYIPPGESSSAVGAAGSSVQAAFDVGSSDGSFDVGGSGASSVGVSGSDDAGIAVSSSGSGFDDGSADIPIATTRSGADFAASQGSFDAASNEAPVSSGGFEKEFYTFSADEQDFTDPSASEQIANSVKQGLRVVFIKGPENRALEDAALSLAKSSANQKTAIYVLNKQTDIAELANKLNIESRNANNKPEVHFVKYRTQEDAVSAQRTIQAEYDALGGNSQNIDGGVAPALNFASTSPIGGASVRQGAGIGGGAAGSFGGFGGSASYGGVGGAGSFGGAVGAGSFGGALVAGSYGSAGAAGGNLGSTYLPASVLRRLRH
uniref:DUF243 domain-containing protein n=1 Tax=Stomoxys calcitrans TaxID=35570 RepID=A0A1I8PRU4_STOCA